jgi:molecular chaperone GrpE
MAEKKNDKDRIEIEIRGDDGPEDRRGTVEREIQPETEGEGPSDSPPDLSETPQETTEVQGEGPETEEKTGEQIIEEYAARVKELEDKYLRLAAEFDNFKKRTARQFEDIIKSSSERIIVELLEVVDNFERALDAGAKAADFASLKAGTQLIYQHLLDILKKQGLEVIDAVGKHFDPKLHEAMMQVDDDESPEGTVVQEIVRGYKLNGKVIRFSKVAVSTGGSRERE